MHHCVRVAMEAYHKLCYHGRSKTGASSSSSISQTSQRSKSTAPTIYSDHRPMSLSKRREPVGSYDFESIHRGDGDYVSEDDEEEDDGEEDDGEENGEKENEKENEEEEMGQIVVVEAQDSTTTYVSTSGEDGGQDEDVEEAAEIADEPRYEVPDRRLEFFPTDPIPSNASTFADLFPSSRRLLIRHDDTTLDGNMNLRVDTTVPHRSGYQADVTLFHLRMYDLFTRRFSFRRYCRDSGREISHSERKKTPALNKRLAHSCSVALANLRPGFASANGTCSEQLKRRRRRHSESRPAKQDVILEIAGPNGHVLENTTTTTPDRPVPETFTNTVMMEFSNYAHVEVRRRNAGVSKYYEYEYWTTKYQWRREFRRDGDLRNVSYHLVDMHTSKTVAHLVPDILTPMEALEEESKGGWVPPSSMWISDSAVYEKMSDVAE